MRSAFRWVVMACVVAAVVGTALALVVKAPEASAAAADPCCFTNPRFSGVCQVVPADDETCASILAYLNNPNSTGKVYCGKTSIRGGWTQVDCE